MKSNKIPRVVILTLSNIFFVMGSGAQTANKPEFQYNQLISGDKVPDFEINNIINYNSPKAHFSDFKGKLVILDFWSTYCISCIELFPHMQMLQDKFKDRLQVILVNTKTSITHDDEVKTRKLLDRLKSNTGIDIRLPVILNCDALDNFFPNSGIPHEVWIDSTGRYIVATSPVDVIEENIQSILEGKIPSMAVKDDLANEGIGPLVSNYINKSYRNIMYQSTIEQGYSGNQMDRIKVDTAGNYHGMTVTNISLRLLYTRAFPELFQNLTSNKVVIDVKDSSLSEKLNYKEKNNRDEIYKNVYSYDLTTASSLKDEDWRNYLRIDLDRTFHLHLSIQKRKIKCFVVTASTDLKNHFSKDSEMVVKLDRNGIKKYVHGATADELLNIFNDYSDRPILNETAINQRLDLNFPDRYNSWDMDSLNKILKDYGFQVTEAESEMDVVVFADR